MSLFHDIRETIRAVDPAERRQVAFWGPIAMIGAGLCMLGFAMVTP